MRFTVKDQEFVKALGKLGAANTEDAYKYHGITRQRVGLLVKHGFLEKTDSYLTLGKRGTSFAKCQGSVYSASSKKHDAALYKNAMERIEKHKDEPNVEIKFKTGREHYWDSEDKYRGYGLDSPSGAADVYIQVTHTDTQTVETLGIEIITIHYSQEQISQKIEYSTITNTTTEFVKA